MAVGLKVWDANGILILDVTDRLGRIIGVTFINNGDVGSIVNDGFLTGEPWCKYERTVAGLNTTPDPAITFLGNTLFYNNTAGAPQRLLYGVR